MKIWRITAAFVLAGSLSGCSTLAFWKKDDKKDAKAQEDDGDGDGDADDKPAKKKVAKAKKPAAEEQELKVAKLWARVDELEEEQLRQKERVRVLEKGLTLGLVPEELKPKKEAAAPPPPPPPPAKAEAPKAKDDAPKDDAPTGLSKEDQAKYQAALASAHDHFRAGRYGRAIVEYSDISKTFGDKADGGMAKYWVAKCWINLKEYNTARQHLGEFLKENPASPWVPRAKLELARVEWKLGLSETALQRFRDVIQQHPYEDAAEMAKMELENLDKSL